MTTANAATLAPMPTLTHADIVVVYSMECDLSRGPRIVRVFGMDADEQELAWECFNEHTATGRDMNYAFISGAAAQRITELRETAVDLSFETREGLLSPAFLAAQETAWSAVVSALL